ncbi:unnamed protein product [Parajaminaea phylloscopi]
MASANEPRRRSRSRSNSAGSRKSRASETMGQDGGEAGRRMAAEDEYIRRELHQDASAFCNSFWGSSDAGFEVVQHRMKVANRTMDEVRQLYKERADIEADYAKRLAKLAKVAVGKDETGATRQALNVVRAEIDMTAQVHSDLSTMIRKDLEGGLAEFQAKIASARKASAASIEKLHKNKQAQDNYVNKSRERYEQDCIKINGYTAQSSLVQGRDLDKVTNKLDKAQSTVAANEKDYQNFVRALKDTTLRWNSDYKSYLDQCQDLEEERLDFIKSNLWNYANAISAVCVADDEGCERVRVALENCDTPTDIADFIQTRGTGPAIPDPPEYINYAKGQPPPARPSFHTANFQRVTTRTVPPPAPPAAPSGYDGGAGVAGPATSAPSVEPTAPVQPPPKEYRPDLTPSGSNPEGPIPPPASYKLPAANAPPAAAPYSATPEIKNERRMSTKNFLARTPSALKRTSGAAEPMSSPMRPPEAAAAAAASSPMATSTVGEDDPMAKALANLRARPGGKSPVPGSHRGVPPSHASAQDAGYRGPAQTQPSSARAPSPGPGVPRPSSPAAAFMQAPQRAASPLPVEEVVGQYGQSFPGERRALSRQNSVASAISHRSGRMTQSPTKATASAGQNRAMSPAPADGFAGVGARGRSPSPQPFGRPASRQQAGSGPHRAGAASASHHPQTNGNGAVNVPPRSTTPLGISLDASGSVTHDQMAHEYMQRAGSVPPPQTSSYHQSQQPPGAGHQPVHPAHAQHRPPSVVYAHQQAQSVGGPGAYQAPPPPGQMTSAGSQFTITPGQYGGQPPNAAPPGHQQQQGGYYAGGHAQAPSAATHQGSFAPPSPHGAPQYAHQDSSSSLGRASGYSHAYGQHQPSASQSFPTMAAQGQPQQPHQQQPQPQPSGPAYAGYGHQASSSSMSSHPSYHHQHQQAARPPAVESPAVSYMHQYQQAQQHVNPAAAPPPSHQSQQQQQQGQWQGQVAPSNGPPAGYGAPPPQSATPAPTAAVSNPAPSASPAPTGQYSDTTGKPILFYVKAMYDYSASSAEEFSFQQGDIIAVTGTDPDGWWTGELLDERRRERGKETFPSNFTTLLT